MARDKFNYTHGDNGKAPASSLNFEKNERPDAQHFDWWWATVINKINKIWNEFSRLDSDDDGVVDAADDADTVDGKHYSDIQSWVNNNADVPNADQADSATSAGDADTLDGFHAEDLDMEIEDDGTEIADHPTILNVGTNLSATDEGGGKTTIGVSGKVDSASNSDTVSGKDGVNHPAGSVPEFADVSTGESEMDRGERFVVKQSDGYHIYLVE